MKKVTVAATQMACAADVETNIANAEKLIREAAARGANIILIQELFQTCLLYTSGQSRAPLHILRRFGQVLALCGSAREDRKAAGISEALYDGSYKVQYHEAVSRRHQRDGQCGVHRRAQRFAGKLR